jgi:hypothetical protein
MSKGTRRKKNGHRKGKSLQAMREGEYRRHVESGVGHRSPRLDPHTGHTRRQTGGTFPG